MTSYGIQRGLKITDTCIKKNEDTKFCIYTHLVNSKFTTWQKPKVFLFRTAVNNLQSLQIVTKRIPLYVQTFLKKIGKIIDEYQLLVTSTCIQVYN